MKLLGSAGATEFLSTPSVRRATAHLKSTIYTIRISIHALREEGDHNSYRSCPGEQYFYPRPP